MYSRVSSAYKWIESEVCKGSLYASEAGFDCSNARYNPVDSVPTVPPPSGGGASNDNLLLIMDGGSNTSGGDSTGDDDGWDDDWWTYFGIDWDDDR